jgi:uncharacterized membrane protein YidH (DUF202 family)
MRDPSQAAERTALAWNRTGLSFVVAGAVVLRVLASRDEIVGILVGTAMLVTGTLAAAYAWRPRDRGAAERAVRRLALATVGLAAATAASALLG